MSKFAVTEKLVAGIFKGNLESLLCSPADFIELQSEYILSECQFRHSSLWIQDMHQDSDQSRALCDEHLQKTKLLSQRSHGGSAPIRE
jgi:hypothetical protein